MAKLVLTIDNKQAIASVESLKKEFNALGKSLSKIEVNKDLTAQINALTKHYKAIADAQAKITANANKQAIADEKLKQQQSKSTAEVVKLAIAQARLEKAQKTTTSTTEQLQKKFANLLSTLKSLKNAYPQGTFDELEKSVRDSLNAAKDSKADVDALSKSYDTLSAKVAVTKAETEKVTTAVVKSGDSIGSLAKKFLLWQVTATLVMKPLRLITDGLNSINETLVKTEDAVIALQRVLPNGSATDGEISSRLYKIAQEYGQTFDNVQTIAINFARTGKSWAETLQATEAAVLALNVAELDAEQATDGLNAVLSQFGLKASELTGVIDKLNKVADVNSVTTEKLLKALQRTGASAKQANISLEETIGIITTLSKATNRSGENLGTAVNSLIQFSSKKSSLDVFAKLGGDVETAVEKYRAGAGSIMEIWGRLAERIKSNSGDIENILGGGLFSDEEWAGLNEGLKNELGEAYADITDIYDTASTFRKNYMVALMLDFDNIKKVLGDIENSQGYSQKENEEYLKSYTAKLNDLKAQWQEIANDSQGLLGIKKLFVDIGSGLLDAVKWTGGLRTALIGIGFALSAMFTTQIMSGMGKIASFFKNLHNPLKNFTIATQAATQAQQAQTLATELQAAADQKAAIANQMRNTASATGAAVEAAETAAIGAQTLATQAQTRADELAAVAAKAKGSAFSTVLGIVGIGVTLISAGIGIYQQYQRQQQQERQEAIEAAEAEKGKAAELANLYAQYKNLNSITNKTAEQEKTFSSIQGKIIEQLGTRAAKLKTLKEETEDYKKVLEELTTKELDEYIKNAQAGANAARTEFDNYQNNVFYSDYGEYVLAGTEKKNYNAMKYLADRGSTLVSADNEKFLQFGYRYDRGRENYSVFERYDIYENDLKTLLENDYGDTGIYSDIVKRQAESKKHIDSLINTQALLDTYKYIKEKGAPQTKDDIKGIVDSIMRATGATETWRDEIESIVLTTTGFKETLEDTADATKDWHNNITKVKTQYDDLINKLKELRDYEDESVNLEEKKAEYIEAQNELLKAQQALENAKNEATVKRFNEATGQWEWQVDEKKVASAEEAVKKQQESVDKAKKDLEKQTYDAIIQALEKETATNDSLIAVLESVRDLLGNDFVNKVQGGIKDVTGVDLTQPVKSYDSGGIANGLGFMPKATAQPESVNDPELTRKILTPRSSAEFDRYVKNMGIMFQQAHTYAQTPIIQRVGATDNSVNNSGQVHIAGITFPAEAQHSPLSTLVGQFKQIPR